MRLWDVETGKEIDAIVVDGMPTSLSVQGWLVAVGNMNATVTFYRMKERK